MITPLSKRLKLLITSLILFNLSGCSGAHWANDNWKGKDKAQHFLFSAGAAAAANAYADRQNMSHRQAAQFGILFSIGLGAAKELYDSRPAGTGWSWHDFTYDIAGAIAGYSLYQSMK